MDRPRDRGASVIEYAGLVVVAGVMAGVLFATGVLGAVGDRTGRAICRIVNDRECATPTGPPSATPSPPPDPPSATPSPRPDPPTGTPSPPPDPPLDPIQEGRRQTEIVLDETPLGRDAKTWIEQNHVRVIYRPGGGSYYADDENTIYIDSTASPESLAALYVHETNHARHRDQPDPHKLSRGDFVDQALSEEAHGTVLQIQESQQIQATRGLGKAPVTSLQIEYEAAYDTAVDKVEVRATAENRTLTADDKRRIGEQAGEARMKYGFAHGEITQSTDHGTYADNYGNQWDDAHDDDGCFLWVFC